MSIVIEEPRTADKIANKNANLLSPFRVNSLSKYEYPSPVIAYALSFSFELGDIQDKFLYCAESSAVLHAYNLYAIK